MTLARLHRRPGSCDEEGGIPSSVYIFSEEQLELPLVGDQYRGLLLACVDDSAQGFDDVIRGHCSDQLCITQLVFVSRPSNGTQMDFFSDSDELLVGELGCGVHTLGATS